MEKDPIFNYRQPLVTAAGIILGFILNFATDLVKQQRKSDLLALMILLTTLIGISLLIVALYRVLNNSYDREQAGRFYKRTLNFFLFGIIFSFAGGLLKMIQALFFS